MSKCADYGKLSNRRADDQLETTRELSGSGKRNPADFALWKTCKTDDEIGWDSPWGRGRPGWHIECSVMSMNHLGETFDIHGGGIDLVFPHHENEIAQSETATCKPYARFWLHNGLTRVKTKASSGEWKNEKMSKSLGNIKQLSELLAEYPAQLIRFFMLSTHYRRPIDFSDEALQAVQKGMMNLYRLIERAGRLAGEDVFAEKCSLGLITEAAQNEADKKFAEIIPQIQLQYLEALDDDFNTARAISLLHDLCSEVNRYIEQNRTRIPSDKNAQVLTREGARMMVDLGQILGLLTGPVETAAESDELTSKLMNLLIEMRKEARQNKNFELADAIRDKLNVINVVLEDSPEGTTWRKE